MQTSRLYGNDSLLFYLHTYVERVSLLSSLSLTHCLTLSLFLYFKIARNEQNRIGIGKKEREKIYVVVSTEKRGLAFKCEQASYGNRKQ